MNTNELILLILSGVKREECDTRFNCNNCKYYYPSINGCIMEEVISKMRSE